MRSLADIFGIVVAGFLLLVTSASGAATTRWYEFKGLYVGMAADEAKKLGVDKCTRGKVFEETCDRNANNKTFATIGGAPIKTMSIIIGKGKVQSFGMEVSAFWPDWIKVMKTRYGKPRKETPTTIMWDRGGEEFISGFVQRGNITVHFGYSAGESDKAIKERAQKAQKDF